MSATACNSGRLRVLVGSDLSRPAPKSNQHDNYMIYISYVKYAIMHKPGGRGRGQTVWPVIPKETTDSRLISDRTAANSYWFSTGNTHISRSLRRDLHASIFSRTGAVRPIRGLRAASWPRNQATVLNSKSDANLLAKTAAGQTKKRPDGASVF